MDMVAAGLPTPAGMVFSAIIMIALSGLPGLLLRRFPGLGQGAATCATVPACLMGMAGATRILSTGETRSIPLPWTLPFGPAELAIDPLSAWFLLPLFLVTACASLYALDYWPAASHPSTEAPLTFFFGILAAAMGVVLTARNGVLFLMAWEAMAIAAYFCLVTDHSRGEVRRAGFIYLAATHTGTLALFIMLGLLRGATGSFAMPAPGTLAGGTTLATVLFLSGLFGFGMKAGIMPLHLWLPSAHANAPSHISALMSALMLKMGVYGLLRLVMAFQFPPLWWGVVLLITGGASALLGIIFASAQQDVKKLLAYSSIENVGIIFAGTGMALVGLSTGNSTLLVLGMTGALLHVLNHSLFKSLLFMGAGAIIHATGTRAVDRMGGLLKRMPGTGLLFLVGCVAICGLPPLNGFVSELLLYLGFFFEARTAPTPLLAVGAPILAVVGGMAALCFIRLYSIVFFGTPRTPAAAGSREIGLLGLVPLGILSCACLLAGLLPQHVTTLAQQALQCWAPNITPGQGASVLPPLEWISAAGLFLLVLVAALGALFRQRVAAFPETRGVTWDCGYLLPHPRMQYSASSFSGIAAALFSGIIRARRIQPTVAGYFPGTAKFATNVPETLVEHIVEPTAHVTARAFSFLRHVQLGKIHIYVLYIFITLVLLLVWSNR